MYCLMYFVMNTWIVLCLGMKAHNSPPILHSTPRSAQETHYFKICDTRKTEKALYVMYGQKSNAMRGLVLVDVKIVVTCSLLTCHVNLGGGFPANVPSNLALFPSRTRISRISLVNLADCFCSVWR